MRAHEFMPVIADGPVKPIKPLTPDQLRKCAPYRHRGSSPTNRIGKRPKMDLTEAIQLSVQ
jgi:hypothetical protein